jgi:hypothetical protein
MPSKQQQKKKPKRDNNNNDNISPPSPPANNTYSRSRSSAEDEAYAEALQEEYRKDFIRRQAKKNQYNQARIEQHNVQQQQQQQHPMVAPSAPPHAYDQNHILPSPFASSNGPTPPPPPPPSFYNMKRSQTVEDERYARQLQAQLEREASPQQQARLNYIRPPYVNTPTTVDAMEQPSLNHHHHQHDVKLAQELQDEEYARQLQNQVLRDNNRLRRQQQQQQQASTSTTSRTSTHDQ